MRVALKKNIPNIITLFRLSLVLPFSIFIHDIIVYNCTNFFSLVIFIFIITSDILDGYLARKLKCSSFIGAKLDILSDTLYALCSMALFVYFQFIPLWFPLVMVIKLIEFMITSKIIKDKYKTNAPVIFDKMGKMAVNMVMLMPGLFVFRCLVANYAQVMGVTVYIITFLFIISFLSRIIHVIKPAAHR